MSGHDSWLVEVSFTGLILFVRKNGRIAHALFREGREGHHDHGQKYPDNGSCTDFVRRDFHHFPLLNGSQGGEPIKQEELNRRRLELRWDADGSDEGGATPCGTAAVPRLPDFDTSLPEELASFSWVPDMAEVSPRNAVDPRCLLPTGPSKEVVTQVAVRGGEIETRRFAHIRAEVTSEVGEDPEVENLIPAMKFATGPEEPGPLMRAAAEEVLWRPKVPENARWLRLVAVALDAQEENEELLAEFRCENGPVHLELTNQPAPRCQGKIHPGRRRGVGGLHFEMFYSLLQAPTFPAVRRLPWAPYKLRLKSGIFHKKNVVKAPPRARSAGSDAPAGDLGLGSGSIHRPLCIPASAEAP